MKENNGKGRRKKLMGKLIMIISSFAILIGFLTILGFGRSQDKLLRNAAATMVQKNDPRKQAWREEMHDQFLDKDESQVLEMILSAEIHLVDLHVEQEEVIRSPPNSYAGVYGSFCQLDFSIHKKDPSSGEYQNYYLFSIFSKMGCCNLRTSIYNRLGYLLLGLPRFRWKPRSQHVLLLLPTIHSPHVP